MKSPITFLGSLMVATAIMAAALIIGTVERTKERTLVEAPATPAPSPEPEWEHVGGGIYRMCDPKTGAAIYKTHGFAGQVNVVPNGCGLRQPQ